MADASLAGAAVLASALYFWFLAGRSFFVPTSLIYTVPANLSAVWICVVSALVGAAIAALALPGVRASLSSAAHSAAGMLAWVPRPPSHGILLSWAVSGGRGRAGWSGEGWGGPATAGRRHGGAGSAPAPRLTAHPLELSSHRLAGLAASARARRGLARREASSRGGGGGRVRDAAELLLRSLLGRPRRAGGSSAPPSAPGSTGSATPPLARPGVPRMAVTASLPRAAVAAGRGAPRPAPAGVPPPAARAGAADHARALSPRLRMSLSFSMSPDREGGAASGSAMPPLSSPLPRARASLSPPPPAGPSGLAATAGGDLSPRPEAQTQPAARPLALDRWLGSWAPRLAAGDTGGGMRRVSSAPSLHLPKAPRPGRRERGSGGVEGGERLAPGAPPEADVSDAGSDASGGSAEPPGAPPRTDTERSADAARKALGLVSESPAAREDAVSVLARLVGELAPPGEWVEGAPLPPAPAGAAPALPSPSGPESDGENPQPSLASECIPEWLVISLGEALGEARSAEVARSVGLAPPRGPDPASLLGDCDAEPPEPWAVLARAEASARAEWPRLGERVPAAQAAGEARGVSRTAAEGRAPSPRPEAAELPSPPSCAASYEAWRAPHHGGLYAYRTRAEIRGVSAAELAAFHLDDAARGEWDDATLALEEVEVELLRPGRVGGHDARGARRGDCSVGGAAAPAAAPPATTAPAAAAPTTSAARGEPREGGREEAAEAEGPSAVPATRSVMRQRARFPRPLAAREYLFARRVWPREDGGCYIVCRAVRPHHRPDHPLAAWAMSRSGCVPVTSYASCLRIEAAPPTCPEGTPRCFLDTVYFEDPVVRPSVVNAAVARGLVPYFERYLAALLGHAVAGRAAPCDVDAERAGSAVGSDALAPHVPAALAPSLALAAAGPGRLRRPPLPPSLSPAALSRAETPDPSGHAPLLPGPGDRPAEPASPSPSSTAGSADFEDALSTISLPLHQSSARWARRLAIAAGIWVIHASVPLDQARRGRRRA